MRQRLTPLLDPLVEPKTQVKVNTLIKPAVDYRLKLYPWTSRIQSLMLPMSM